MKLQHRKDKLMKKLAQVNATLDDCCSSIDHMGKNVNAKANTNTNTNTNENENENENVESDNTKDILAVMEEMPSVKHEEGSDPLEHFQYVQEARSLIEMGFTNVEQIKNLLVYYIGNVDQVLAELVQYS